MVREIVKKRTKVGLKTICLILKVNRSSYYAWLKRTSTKRAQENTQLVEKIKTIHHRSRQTYGAPRVTEELRAQGYSCGRNRVARLMRKAAIFGCARKKFRAAPTDYSQHNFPICPRLFETASEKSLPTSPHQIWVGDITHIATQEGWLYLSIVMDVFNRKIVGFSMADHMRSEMAWEAMKKGICAEGEALLPGRPALIAHSDRGGQYASSYYQGKLGLMGIVQSMSRKGNCYDNAFAESFFHTLKVELVHRKVFQTRAQAQLAITEYVDWYNTKRRHSGIGYKTPCEFEKMALVA